MGAPFLTLDRVAKHYGTVTAVGEVSLAVAKGQLARSQATVDANVVRLNRAQQLFDQGLGNRAAPAFSRAPRGFPAGPCDQETIPWAVPAGLAANSQK